MPCIFAHLVVSATLPGEGGQVSHHLSSHTLKKGSTRDSILGTDNRECLFSNLIVFTVGGLRQRKDGVFKSISRQPSLGMWETIFLNPGEIWWPMASAGQVD